MGAGPPDGAHLRARLVAIRSRGRCRPRRNPGAEGVHLAFVEMRSRLRDLVSRYGLDETLDRDHYSLTVEEALADIARIDAARDPGEP